MVEYDGNEQLFISFSADGIWRLEQCLKFSGHQDVFLAAFSQHASSSSLCMGNALLTVSNPMQERLAPLEHSYQKSREQLLTEDRSCA